MKWFGDARRAYNAAIEHLRQPDTKASWKTIKGGILQALPAWAKKTPYQIKSVAIRDACQAVSNAKLKYKETGEFQEVGFRSRKDPKQSCFLPALAVSKKGVYYTLSGNLKWSEPPPDDCGDCRLVKNDNCWDVCLSVQEKRQVSDIQGTVVALDPGIRTFMTFYTESGCGKLGKHDFGRLQRLCSFLDGLISKTKKEKQTFRKLKLNVACRRMWTRIRNLVDELHHKVAVFLVKNFDVILLPTFETQEMSLRAKRRLTRKSVRSLLTFAHYRFKQFLKQKAFEYGKLVFDVNEAYTSKTVSWTGEIVNNLGGAKSIRSKNTGEVMDRDYNGARGIFLRALGDDPFLRRNLQECSGANL